MIRFEQLRAALALEIGAWEAQLQMSPSHRRHFQPDPHNPPRESAVLILIYPDATGQLRLILTKRTDKLRGHSGQVSFPGGRRDPHDASFVVTALRETCEELGICDEAIEIIGQLNKLWIPPSNFDVYPIVGCLAYEPQIFPNPDEVDFVLTFALADLLHPAFKKTTQMTLMGQLVDVPYYDVEGQVVWGATCMLLSELEARIRAVGLS